MDMIRDVFHFVGQSFDLCGETMAVLGMLTVLGAGPVWLTFPASAKVRWPIFAPLAGLAVVTIICVPLALFGVPVAHIAPVISSAGLVVSLIIALRMSKSLRGRRILLAWIRCRGLASAGVMMVVIAVSTALITQGGRGNVRDVWGSGDFGAYWVVADFMQQHGATVDAYQNQTAFHASDILSHLSRHARLGCMVYLAFIGALLSPTAIHQVIAPSIVTLMLLMLGLAQCWLDFESPRPRLVLAILLFHPFLYFLLYFTYASQASGVVLCVTGLLIGGRKKAGVIEAILSGCLIGSAILHYPSMLLVAGVFWVLQFFTHLRAGQWRRGLLGSLAGLVVCGVYLPNILNELVGVARAAVLPGWDWRGLIGSLEFIGLRSVLGYEMPEARNMGLRFVDYTLIIVFGALFYAGFRRSRMRIVVLTIAVPTFLLSGAAVLKYLQHVPHASHTIVKTLSTFSVFLCLIAAVPLAHWFGRSSATRRKVAGFCMMLLVAGQALALLRSEPQESWFGADLIQLTRRLLDRSPDVRVRLAISNPRHRKRFRGTGAASRPSAEGLPNMHWELAAPIVRDERRLIPNDPMLRANCFTIFSDREISSPGDVSVLADRQGEYYALPVRHSDIRGPTDSASAASRKLDQWGRQQSQEELTLAVEESRRDDRVGSVRY